MFLRLSFVITDILLTDLSLFIWLIFPSLSAFREKQLQGKCKFLTCKWMNSCNWIHRWLVLSWINSLPHEFVFCIFYSAYTVGVFPGARIQAGQSLSSTRSRRELVAASPLSLNFSLVQVCHRPAFLNVWGRLIGLILSSMKLGGSVSLRKVYSVCFLLPLDRLLQIA